MRREILIDSVTPETRVALLEDDVPVELFVERPSGRGLAGNVYKGRVRNILPGMQAAFVDIGASRDAFLYVEDLAAALEDDDPAARDEDETPRTPETPPGIDTLLKEGQEVLVQVTKDPVPEKGARVTSLISFPGRFLVYLPAVSHVGVSRRIDDEPERARLKQAGRDALTEIPAGGGLIVRTSAQGRPAEAIAREAGLLAQAWRDLQERARAVPPPALLREDPGAVTRVLRDLLRPDLAQVVVDGRRGYDEVAAIVARDEPDLLERIRLHEGRDALFEARGVERQLERALRPRLWLKSGGSIVLQSTEALVAVDVNTGKYVGTRRLEETILRTNLEAAVEIVRQIRLRDLGGIIVVDFIDMQEQVSKDEVLKVLRRELQRDRAKSRILEISEFGLVEITRQRTRRSLERLLCRPCPTCAGSGRLKSPETLLYEILREVRRLQPLDPGSTVVARVHPDVAAFFEGRGDAGGGPPGAPSGVALEPDTALRQEEFRLVVREPAAGA